MAVREFKNQRYRERRQQSRRDLIARTARIWTKLYREATANLKAITSNWLKKFLKQAQQEIASGYVSDIQELPSKFTQTLERTLRQALAQGYWLNHVYVQELRHAKQGTKYHGRINLSDKDEEEKLIEVLQAFMNEEVSDEWQEVIPESAVNWLKDYVPKLAGVLSADVLEKTREVIRGSMMTGSTLQERMKALRESSDVLLRMTDARIETIARTEITRADSMGRLIEMKGNDDVIGVEFSAIMDDRTTEMCAERHGLVMRLDDPRLPENTPPIHPRCRSMLLSLTVYDYPDGVLTSHEFDEVHSGIQRETDIEEFRKILDSDYMSMSGAMSGAWTDKNDPNDEKRNAHAERYY
ncbi:MAG: minor capsid protein, partial [Synergistaceae bacterium]|nr:minor capsid protein [Synergistaceae bacterium]